MGTYYDMVCTLCKTRTAFVSTSCGGPAGWLTSAPDGLLPFFDRHREHLEDIRVMSEFEVDGQDCYITDESERPPPPA